MTERLINDFVIFAHKIFLRISTTKNMETVFDFNITAKEWQNLQHTDVNSYKLLLMTNIGERLSNSDISRLLLYRGEKEKAKEYISRLPLDMQHEVFRTMEHLP